MKINSILKNITFIIGAAFLISSVANSSYLYLTICLKIIFIVLLVSWYSFSVKNKKPQVYSFFLSALCAETFFSLGFDTYYFFVIISFTVCFLSGVLLLIPLIKSMPLKLHGFDLLAALIVFFSFIYTVGSIFLLSIKQLADYTFFPIVTISFLLFALFCFYVTSKYNHPKSVFLLLTGLGYTITCLCGLLYYFYFQNKLLMLLIDISELTAQLSFAYFMINYEKVIEVKNDIFKP